MSIDGEFVYRMVQMEALQKARSDSRDCPGPRIEIRTVQKGIIHRTIVQEEVFACGLQERPIAESVPTVTPKSTQP